MAFVIEPERLPVVDPVRLTAKREASGLKREHVAVALGITVAAIASYEQPGRNTPPGNILVALAALYGCKVEELCSVKGRTAIPVGAR